MNWLATSHSRWPLATALTGPLEGLYDDYGSAQRLYVRRGYLPDGRGVMYDYEPVRPGGSIRLDDDAILMMTKPLAN